MGLGYQGAPVVAATANLTGTTPQGVQGQVVASNDHLARTPPQGVQSQVAVSNDHSAANPPRNTVEAIPNRGHVSETGPLALGA